MTDKFEKKILENGMTVILEKRDLPIISCAFAVKSGAKDENEKEKGISHFIEHLLYKGTKKRTSLDISREIEMNGGQLNGFTSESIVAYWAKMPSDKIDIALDVLSDLVKNPLFDEKEIEKERQVIFEEIKMYKDNPRMHALNRIKEKMYESPFGMNIAGTYESMNGINRDKLIEYYKKTYTTNNLILCVVGDTTFEKLEKFALENFEKTESKIEKRKITKKREEEIESRSGVDQANIIFAYPVPTANEKENYAAEVLSTILAGGMSSRLFTEIREKRNLAYSVKGDADIEKDFAYNMIFVGTMKENVEKVKKIIIEEIEKISKEIEEIEIEENKNKIIGNFKIGCEDSQSQMDRLLISEINGDAKELYEYEKNIKNVKKEEIQKIAKSALENYSFYALVPKD